MGSSYGSGFTVSGCGVVTYIVGFRPEGRSSQRFGVCRAEVSEPTDGGGELHGHVDLDGPTHDLLVRCIRSWGKSPSAPLLCVSAHGQLLHSFLLWTAALFRAVVSIDLDRQAVYPSDGPGLESRTNQVRAHLRCTFFPHARPL